MAEITARQLALVESQRLFRVLNLDRVEREMRAIDEIKAKRLAAKANRFRRNYLTAAACLSCCAAGILISVFFTHTSGTPIPKISAQTKNSQWIGKVLDASSPIVISSSPLTQTAKYLTTTTSPIQVVKVDPLPAPQPTQAVTRITAATAAAVNSSIFQFVAPAKPKEMTIAKIESSKKVATLVRNVPQTIPNTVKEKGNDEAEVVLPTRSVPNETVDPRFQEKASIATGSDFKVVNVIDGALIVRQGEAVRQFQIGDQLPSGKTLKSVNAENGKFEVAP